MTITVDVMLMGQLQNWAGRRKLSLQLPVKHDVDEFLSILTQSLSEQLQAFLLNEQNVYKGSALIAINGIAWQEGTPWHLQDQDQIVIMSPIAGG